MRLGLITVRIGILVVSVVTAMLLLLAVVPLSTGGLNIKFPQDQTTGWTYDSSTRIVTFEAPVQVDNGGFFDIQDLSVGIRLSDPNGSLISESASPPKDILAGRTTFLDVRMDLDLNSLDPSLLRELAFNHTALNMSLTLSTYYMERLVNLHIGADRTMDWTPLIDNLQFDLQDLQIQQNGSAYSVQIPYGFDAGDLMVGKQANVMTILRNPSGALGSGSDTISIMGHYAGTMEIDLDHAAAEGLATRSDNLTVDVIVDFEGAEFRQSYTRQWEPLLSDLVVGTPMISTGNWMSAEVPFSFNASNAIVGSQMQIGCSIDNATTSVSQGFVTVFMDQHTQGRVSIPFSAPESAWFLRHSQDWTITLKATFMGLTVTQSRSYHWNAPQGGP
jgi:hypothetical protein